MTQNKGAMERLAEKGVEFRRTPEDILEESLDVWHRILAPSMRQPGLQDDRRQPARMGFAERRRPPHPRARLEGDRRSYWAPGGLVESGGTVDFEYTAPDYYDRFRPEASQ
jgi:hypothetical protein